MNKQRTISHIILFLFIILVSFTAFLSDVFQKIPQTGTQIVEQGKLLSTNELSSVEQLILKNKSGEFSFKRFVSNNTISWQMNSPRSIAANSPFIEKLFNTITQLKIKKVYPDQKINTSNFLIDKPSANLTLVDSSGKKTFLIFGLMNSIDNSTYLKIEGRAGIFHVDAPNLSLENTSLSDLIEVQTITINFDSVIALTIFHGPKKSLPPQLELVKDKENWLDKDRNILSKEKVMEFFGELSQLKTHFMIEEQNEKQTENQKKQIQLLIKNPQLILSITDDKNLTTDFSLSKPIRNIPELDLKNEEYILINNPTRPIFHLLKKESLEILNRKMDFFKN